MDKQEQIEKLINAALFIAMFKGSTDDIDSVISDLSGVEFHTTKQYSENQFDGKIGCESGLL
jgi:hypothetical protein